MLSQAHDVPGFAQLSCLIGDRLEAFLTDLALTDLGSDADAIRQEFAAAVVETVIAARSNRRNRIPHNWGEYCWPNLVERLFKNLKTWRRVALRYD